MYKHCILTSDSTQFHTGAEIPLPPPSPATISPTQKSWKSMVAIYVLLNISMCHQNVVLESLSKIVSEAIWEGLNSKFFLGGPTPPISKSCMKPCQWVKAAFYSPPMQLCCVALLATVCKGTLHSQKFEVDTPQSNTNPFLEMCACPFLQGFIISYVQSLLVCYERFTHKTSSHYIECLFPHTLQYKYITRWFMNFIEGSLVSRSHLKLTL